MKVNKRYCHSTSGVKSARLFARKNDGFTLPELMVTVAISGILLTVGLPGYSNFIKDNHQTTLLNGFSSFFHYAKNEAVTRRSPVTICPRNTAGSNCVNSTSWDDGWIVFVDINGDGDVDAGDSVLKTHEAIHSDINIMTSSSSITINERGINTTVSTPKFTFCDSRGSSHTETKILSKTSKVKKDTSHLACS